MPGSSERPSMAATPIAAPDRVLNTVASRIDSTYWRPFTRPTRVSMDRSSTSTEFERNRISPIRMNSGMVTSDCVVVVS